MSSPTLISTTVSMSAHTSAPSPPRSTRPPAARKRPNDPTWFSNAPTAPPVKRQAMDRMESEQRKRKRMEPTVQGLSQAGQERQNEDPPVVSAAEIHQHLSVVLTASPATDGLYDAATGSFAPVFGAI